MEAAELPALKRTVDAVLLEATPGARATAPVRDKGSAGLDGSGSASADLELLPPR